MCILIWLLVVPSQACQCDRDNTELCHPWTGVCKCKVGWDGETCGRPCPFYTYGKGCKKKCNCKNNAQCSPIDGSCICAAGYKGEDCSQVCPDNTFGEDCAQRCACKNDATCSPESGHCNCTEGKCDVYVYDSSPRTCCVKFKYYIIVCQVV